LQEKPIPINYSYFYKKKFMSTQKFYTIFIFLFLFAFAKAQVQNGKASFYADKFEGRQTASGAIYKHGKATGAHRTLPFGTKVRVINLANNRSEIITINDRGPFVSDRIIDVSKSIASKLNFINEGVTDVIVEIVGDADTAIDDIVDEEDVLNDTTDEGSYPTATIPTEFYSLEVSRTDPKGYGIQIGSFQELANLIRLTDNLERSYENKVTAQVKTVQGIQVYTLIIGNFDSRDDAERFNRVVSKRYPGSFIVDFSKYENVGGK
jgi:rare lipoprotein A